MIKQRPIELLAPAKNLECGIEAINHGADAVYIGAPRFGARAAAGNTIEDIKALVDYAHIYNVRIYVTVNTILYGEELPETEKMIWELYRAGVDALIIQDMGITRLNLPPIALHGSTQMDNRTPEKVKFLSDIGFRQVVLARELSLEEIKKIHDTCPDTLLEVFVHGALCVSYSGQCYVSQACYGRSANRGECAQFCRLAFDLVDSNGKTIEQNKHLLSLKDMNQSDNLEALLDAGATSLKIEGRLKDVSYVKNVTAYYRQKLDAIFKYRKEYVRASSGTVKTTFTPQLDKSFSRGFTDYFLRGRNPGIFSFRAERKIAVDICLAENSFGFTLSLTDEDDNSVSITLQRAKEHARTPQTDNLKNQLGKLGNTPFEAKNISIDFSDNWFIPSSELSELRRNAVEKLLEARKINYNREVFRMKESKAKFPVGTLTYLGNVMNSSAAEFYKNHGVMKVMPAFEKEPPKDAVLMFCKHCIRYSMGWCPVHHKVRSPFREPYYLVSSDGRRFRLEFDCKQCQMKVLSDNSEQK